MGYHIDLEYFRFSTDQIKIKYMRECILNSYRVLPYMFWGEEEFKNVYIDFDTVKINIEEWMPFYEKVIEMLQGDETLTIKFIRCLKDNLYKYINCVEKMRDLYKLNRTIDPNFLRDCFEMYSVCQSYAFFNLLPIELFRKYIKDGVILDKCLVSLMGSHRNIRQQKELELARAYNENVLTRCEMEQYIDNEYLLNYEYEWNFYNRNQYDDKRVMRNIVTLSKKYTSTEINNQLLSYKKRRRISMQEVHGILNEKYHNVGLEYYQALLLLNIATQEEMRHIINVRFMNIIGEIAYDLGIDVARTSTEEFLRMVIYQ